MRVLVSSLLAGPGYVLTAINLPGTARKCIPIWCTGERRITPDACQFEYSSLRLLQRFTWLNPLVMNPALFPSAAAREEKTGGSGDAWAALVQSSNKTSESRPNA